MTTTQIIRGGPAAAIRWKRGFEPRQDYTEDGSLHWGERTIEDGILHAGMVATVVNGDEVAPADGGRFRGILFTPVDMDIDDTASGHSGPTVVVSNGSGKGFVNNKALVADLDYAGGQYLTSGTGENIGRLVPQTPDAGGNYEITDATVAYCQYSQADGIFIQFRAPSI